jgi:hypothetical protein
MSALGTKLRLCEGDKIMFWCPGCGHAHGIGIKPPNGWTFNGNPDSPTFTPSVLVQSHTWTPPVHSENLADWKRKPWDQEKVGTICHSFVTDGQIQFLGDCTHALAGQTVPLPNWADK